MKCEYCMWKVNFYVLVGVGGWFGWGWGCWGFGLVGG